MDELNGSETSTRRGLLSAFARSAARRAREGADLISPGGDQAGSAGAVPTVPATPARHPARTPARAASLDELLMLAHDEGLTQRDDELRALARRSLRMTAIEPPHADGWILTSDDEGPPGDEVLRALINLAPASGQDCELPESGWLALFVESAESSDGSEARRAHGVVLDMPATIPDAADAVALSSELVLPRRWHEAVQALDLEDAEGDAYERLRTQLQALQDVESDDDGGLIIAYHRLLGYPNETTGNMPGECVRALHAWSDGVDTDRTDPPLPSYECRLLVQISVGERRRLYVWIHQADLAARDFGRLCAFVR